MPAEKVVAHLCAIQAQDHAASLWAIGLRCGADSTISDIERAIEERRIVRTWPMRGTLHFVAAQDVHWLLRLLAPRVAPTWKRRHRELGLAPADLDRAAALFTEALSGGRRLTRAEMLALLENDGISTEGQRGYHVLAWLSQQGLLCLGPQAGSQQTFVLLDEWAPPDHGHDGMELDHSRDLGRLAERFVRGHGPISVDDLARWGRLPKSSARAGIEAGGDGLRPLEVGGETLWTCAGDAPPATVEQPDGTPRVHLLPGFDEYYVGYRDRSFTLGEYHDTYASFVASNGMLRPILVIDGGVTGVWRRSAKRDRIDVTVQPFRRLTRDESDGTAAAAKRLGLFFGREVNLEFIAP